MVYVLANSFPLLKRKTKPGRIYNGCHSLRTSYIWWVREDHKSSIFCNPSFNFFAHLSLFYYLGGICLPILGCWGIYLHAHTHTKKKPSFNCTKKCATEWLLTNMQLFNQYHNQDIKYFPYLKMFLVFIYRQSPSPPPLQFLTTFDHFVSLWVLSTFSNDNLSAPFWGHPGYCLPLT